MAYAVHYRFKWRSAKDNVYKIEILENNYSGSVVQRPLGGAPQLRRNKNGNICGTSLEFQAQALVDGELASLYSVSATAYRVDLYQGSTLIWQGFITPELYSEPYIAPPYNVKVTATDNLGELKLSDYVGQGLDTVANQLSYILGKTGLSFSTHWLSAMHPSSATSVTAANMPSSTRINLNHMEGKSCHDVLQALLATFNATIVQYGCAWCIVRETDLEALRSGATITAPDGTTFSIADFGSMASEVWWPVGYLSQTVVPAKKKKVITAPNNWIENLLPKTATSSTNATYNAPSDGDTPYYELVPWNGSQQYSQASIAFWSPSSEFVPVKDLNLSLVIQTFGVLAGHTYGKKCAAVTVRLVCSDGSSYVYYYLGADGNLTSSSVEAMSIYGVGQDAPEEHNLVIPVASQMSSLGITKVYQIQVGITTTDAEDAITRMRLYGWTCNVPEQNKGYQVTCILNNGARGEDNETEIAAADNTNKNLESVFVTNGFKYTAALGGASIAEWASSNISSMALLEFLARDYSLGIAVPRLRMEGALSIPQSVGLPLLFRGGGLIYWPETFDWNLLDDAINVSMLSLPAASVQVTSVTRTAEGSQGMVVSSGGSAPASGGGGGTGTVTSVALTMPTQFTVTGSPVTGAGTFAVTLKNTYEIPTATICQKWSAAYDNMHTHSNKSVLDGITSTKVSNWDDAYSKEHTHSNKSTLDGISSSDISSWNGAVTTANNAYAAAVTNKISDQSGITGSATNLVTGAAVFEYVGSHSSNDHVTGFSWSGGTSSGPTGSITQSESSAVSVPAIPSASATASGVVTTGTQTFAGEKTFTGNVNVSGKMKAAILAIPTTAPSSDTDWTISIDTSAISGSVV